MPETPSMTSLLYLHLSELNGSFMKKILPNKMKPNNHSFLKEHWLERESNDGLHYFIIINFFMRPLKLSLKTQLQCFSVFKDNGFICAKTV